MLSGLTNAPTTFYTLTNKLFQPFFDQFVVMYLEDIIVYSQTLEEHIEHLKTVFCILRENRTFKNSLLHAKGKLTVC